jgi:branched-chain amino acid transport system permease protein
VTIATLGIGEIVGLVILNWESLTRGPIGVSGIPPLDLFGLPLVSTESVYWLTLVTLIVLALIQGRLLGSHLGRTLRAIREDDVAARAYGINATRTTLAAFAISGFMAAFAGVLYVHHQSGLGTASFFPFESLNAFSMVVIGGLGSLSGALLGAFYVRGAQYFLPGNWAQLARCRPSSVHMSIASRTKPRESADVVLASTSTQSNVDSAAPAEN